MLVAPDEILDSTPQWKEQFSKAYLGAVAAATGCTLYGGGPDLYSEDKAIRADFGRGVPVRLPVVRVQLKCTSRHFAGEPTVQLGERAVEHLSLTVPHPAIVVLVRVAQVRSNWLGACEHGLLLGYEARWVSGASLACAPGCKSVRVAFPQANVFNPDVLANIMRRLSAGGLP